MFKHRLNGTSRDRVNRASSACVACPDGSPLASGVLGCVSEGCEFLLLCCQCFIIKFTDFNCMIYDCDE